MIMEIPQLDALSARLINYKPLRDLSDLLKFILSHARALIFFLQPGKRLFNKRRETIHANLHKSSTSRGAHITRSPSCSGRSGINFALRNRAGKVR